jgi:hypothetical protein
MSAAPDLPTATVPQPDRPARRSGKNCVTNLTPAVCKATIEGATAQKCYEMRVGDYYVRKARRVATTDDDSAPGEWGLASRGTSACSVVDAAARPLPPRRRGAEAFLREIRPLQPRAHRLRPPARAPDPGVFAAARPALEPARARLAVNGKPMLTCTRASTQFSLAKRAAVVLASPVGTARGEACCGPKRMAAPATGGEWERVCGGEGVCGRESVPLRDIFGRRAARTLTPPRCPSLVPPLLRAMSLSLSRRQANRGEVSAGLAKPHRQLGAP